MHHGENVTTEIVAGLKELWRRFELDPVPASKLDETLNIATWNIRAFGAKPRLEASIHYIAEIIGQFDLVAITELRKDLTDLRRVLDILGPYWDVVYSDWTPDFGGNNERIAYVYDKRAAVFTGLAAEADPKRKKIKVSDNPERFEYIPEVTWWRSPFMASFRAGNFEFVLLTAHIRWGKSKKDREAALTTLADWVHTRHKDAGATDRDIILMGDFNIPSVEEDDALYRAITSKGLRMPTRLAELEFGSNLAKSKRYDQILHYPTRKLLFTGAGGVLDFYMGDHKPLFPNTALSKIKFTYQLSDHLPLWIQINTDNDEIQLDQILSRRKQRQRARSRQRRSR